VYLCTCVVLSRIFYICNEVRKKSVEIRIVLVTLMAALLLLTACGIGTGDDRTLLEDGYEKAFFAQGFLLATHQDHVLICDPTHPGEILQSLHFIDSGLKQPAELCIRRDSPRYVCLSSVYMAFLTTLGETANIVGAPDSSYLFDSRSKTLIRQGRMAVVTHGAAVDVEKILALSPTVVFANRMQKGELHQLIKKGIPVVFPDEFNENTPLGRTEWIRVFGRIAGKQALADSLFSQIVLRYQNLQQLTAQLAINRPTIFGGMEFQGIWYVSGGLSYIAHLYRDAGADYLFDDNVSPASIPLDFEVVLDRGASSDFWRIILAHPDTISYDLIAKANRHYTKFSAFQNKKVIACNPSLTAYFEKGILEPDVVLSDLIYAVHPELLPEYLPTYYKIIK